MFATQKEGIIIYKLKEDPALETIGQKRDPVDIMVSNAAVNCLLGCQNPESSINHGVSIDKESAKVPIFNFDANFDNHVAESEEVDRSGLKSLDDVLRQPSLLGEAREIVIHMKSISNESRQVQLTH